MKLVKAHITNFRSVEDSGDFEVDQLASFVGKNEAGKTAILQALTGFNPHPSTPFEFDIERDYPRRFLTEYEERHGDEQALVVRTEWLLSQDERDDVATLFGDDVLTKKPIIGLRRYGAKDPEWEPEIDYKKAIQHLMTTHQLSAWNASL